MNFTASPTQIPARAAARRRAYWLLPVAALTVIALAWLLWPRPFHGLLLDASAAAPDFTLTTHMGQRMSLSEHRGKVVVLYFGYTHCPDACPTAMAKMGRAMQVLGKRSDGVQVFMVSVDPERDSPARLGEYVTHFDPRFVGLTGTADEIAAAATPFGIYYQAQKIESASGYTVDHTTTLTVVDKAGRMRLVYPLETPAEDIAGDLNTLLRERSK